MGRITLEIVISLDSRDLCEVEHGRILIRHNLMEFISFNLSKSGFLGQKSSVRNYKAKLLTLCDLKNFNPTQISSRDKS